MENVSNSVNMTIRIDKDLKNEVDLLFKNLGISTNSAITMFLKQCNRIKGLPFTPNLAPAPSDELMEALEEAKGISTGKIDSKTYNNVNEMIKDILDDY